MLWENNLWTALFLQIHEKVHWRSRFPDYLICIPVFRQPAPFLRERPHVWEVLVLLWSETGLLRWRPDKKSRFHSRGKPARQHRLKQQASGVFLSMYLCRPGISKAVVEKRCGVLKADLMVWRGHHYGDEFQSIFFCGGGDTVFCLIRRSCF